MVQFPIGTVTFLFTDIEGSTTLLQQLGKEYARMLGEHQALLRAAWAAHDGAEIDTAGDGFFVAFASAPEAVAAAADATRALADHAWPAGTPLRVRIGLHTGTPQLVGDHYVGLDVHRAARIAAAGHGGQVLLSQTTRDLAAQRLPAGATLRAVGAHRLKDLQEPEPLYQLVLPDLPADFPPLKTLDTHQHNLPVQPTPLLGREEQVAAVSGLLRRPDVRLVTLTGPGGIGKTHLALQVAAELVEDFADGVWFVLLSRLVDPDLVLPTVAQTLGLREQGGTPIADILREHLRARQLLLVLDNCEQVVAAAPAVGGLLGACPGLRVLATSRIPLRLRGEKAYPVTPLALAEAGHVAPEHLTQYAAVALFIERARDAKPDFAVTAANAPAIAEICVRLDGLPLAIELAAAKVKLLPPPALLQRLERQLPVLTDGARDLEERQQTMRSTLAWSYHLLRPAEQRLFGRLAVFVGSFALEAAEAICTAPEGVGPLSLEVLDGLGALVDQSLVQRGTVGQAGAEEGGSEARFRLLYVIREYALEQLEASGEADALRQAHAAYYAAIAEPMSTATTYGESLAHTERLEGEQDNLRSALAWLRTRAEAVRQTGAAGRLKAERAGPRRDVEPPRVQGLRLAGALVWAWAYRGHLSEGRAWLEVFLALDTTRAATREAPVLPPRPERAKRESSSAAAARSRRTMTVRAASQTWVRARALYAAGVLAYWQGDSDAAVPLLEQSLALARAVGDRPTAGSVLTGYVLTNLGMAFQDQGGLARARICFEESLALGQALDDWIVIANTLTNLGRLALVAGDLDQAQARSEEAVAVSRQHHYHTGTAMGLAVQALIAWQQGELSRAVTLAREGLALYQAAVDERHYGNGLEVCAILSATQGRTERAARLLGAAAASRARIGMPRSMEGPTAVDIESAVAPGRAALGEEAWAAAFATGQALTLEEAVAEALDEAD
jgi:predicted ATPase/class 3 adenylate cyclase